MGLPLAKMTLAEFLGWEEQQPERHEFYRGDVYAMVGGSARHNRVILNLSGLMAEHLDGSGCQVFAESMKLQVAEGILNPDVVVSCAAAEAGDEHIVSDPKLVIEVLSPSARGYDKRDKFALYRTVPTLIEYGLIDPATRQIEVFTLTDTGAWLFTDQTRSAALTLSSIGLTLPVERVFRGVKAG